MYVVVRVAPGAVFGFGYVFFLALVSTRIENILIGKCRSRSVLIPGCNFCPAFAIMFPAAGSHVGRCPSADMRKRNLPIGCIHCAVGTLYTHTHSHTPTHHYLFKFRLKEQASHTKLRFYGQPSRLVFQLIFQ